MFTIHTECECPYTSAPLPNGYFSACAKPTATTLFRSCPSVPPTMPRHDLALGQTWALPALQPARGPDMLSDACLLSATSCPNSDWIPHCRKPRHFLHPAPLKGKGRPSAAISSKALCYGPSVTPFLRADHIKKERKLSICHGDQ